MGIAEYIKVFKVSSSFDGKTYTPYRPAGQRKDKVTLQYEFTIVIFIYS